MAAGDPDMAWVGEAGQGEAGDQQGQLRPEAGGLHVPLRRGLLSQAHSPLGPPGAKLGAVGDLLDPMTPG